MSNTTGKFTMEKQEDPVTVNHYHDCYTFTSIAGTNTVEVLHWCRWTDNDGDPASDTWEGNIMTTEDARAKYAGLVKDGYQRV